MIYVNSYKREKQNVIVSLKKNSFKVIEELGSWWERIEAKGVGIGARS